MFKYIMYKLFEIDAFVAFVLIYVMFLSPFILLNVAAFFVYYGGTLAYIVAAALFLEVAIHIALLFTIKWIVESP